MKYSFTFFSIFIFITFCFFQNVNSQSEDGFDLTGIIDPDTGLPSGVTEQVSIEQNPQIPKPGEIVSIRITSYLTDLNKAKITWSQDDKVVLSQTGATTNQFQAPESGKTKKIIITITKEGGGTITKTILLSPADVDLIYEAQTYAHPFFKGKKLFTSESFVQIIAVPNFIGSNGQKISASNLVYTWSINGKVEQSISGYGKNTFITKGELIERGMQISVDVSALNSSLIATQSINLKSTSPDLVIYENNPTLGVVYEKAIQGSFLLERPQIDFEAVPYFFSAQNKKDLNISYKWSINGNQVLTKSPNENYLLLQNDQNQEGTAIISATVKHLQNLLQNTQAKLELNFKKIDNTNNEEFNF